MSLALLASLAALPAAAAAQAATHASLSMHVSANKVLYGHGVTLAGHLSGRHAGGKTVVINARPYGSSAPHTVAAVTTTSKGVWAYRVNPTIQTTYQAHIGRTTSPRMTVGVVPRIALAELANGRVRVQVTPPRAFAGRSVKLQQPGAAGTWQTIVRKPLGRAGTAVMAPRGGSSTLRAAMSVNQAGAGYLGAVSHPFRYQALGLFMKPLAFKVMFGHKTTLTGRLVHGRAGQHVTILARRYGRSAPIVLKTTTAARGRFSLAVRPRIMTTYRARFGGILQRHGVTIGVRPTITLRQLGNGALRTRVWVGTSFRGKFVKLQQKSGSGWRTVAKRPLNAASTATFTLKLPRSLVRMAMSVNQAGAGYLGSTSHPLTYRAL